MIVLCGLTAGIQLKAANFTVKAGGGGTSTTIAACIVAMSASGGDTCTVFAGTFNESPTLKSGAAGNLNVLTSNPGDRPIINGTVTMGNYTTLNGFEVAAHEVQATNGQTHFNVTNNFIHDTARCVDEGQGGPGHYTDFGYIADNTLQNCNTHGILINGDHHLVEGNDISLGPGDFMGAYGAFNVIRKEVHHDASNSATNHVDGIESQCDNAGLLKVPSHTVYENVRIQNNVSANAHMWLVQSQSAGGCNSNGLILRENVGYQIGTYGIVEGLGSSPGPYENVKNYNNTVVSGYMNSGKDIFDSFGNSTGGAEINNLWYNVTMASTGGWSCCSGAGTTPVARNMYWFNTSAWDAGCPGNVCSFRDPFNTSTGAIKNKDPLFANLAAGDFHLQSGSPAIGAGSYLTTISSATGSGTTVTLGDAGFFQAGYGVPGVQDDWIRIGASTTVQLTGINYATNAVTLSGAVSWNQGDPVYLYKDTTGAVVLTGTAPDVGAFAFQTGTLPVAPPNLTATAR